METAGAASDTLDNEPRVFIDENGHRVNDEARMTNDEARMTNDESISNDE
jgi:hypothetical protein